MDSDAIEDLCGICKGDGTQCKITDELFKGSPGHGNQASFIHKLKNYISINRICKNNDDHQGK